MIITRLTQTIKVGMVLDPLRQEQITVYYNNKKEGQEDLNRSPKFLKLSYRYLLKAGHVPGEP